MATPSNASSTLRAASHIESEPDPPAAVTRERLLALLLAAGVGGAALLRVVLLLLAKRMRTRAARDGRAHGERAAAAAYVCHAVVLLALAAVTAAVVLAAYRSSASSSLPASTASHATEQRKDESSREMGEMVSVWLLVGGAVGALLLHLAAIATKRASTKRPDHCLARATAAGLLRAADYARLSGLPSSRAAAIANAMPAMDVTRAVHAAPQASTRVTA